MKEIMQDDRTTKEKNIPDRCMEIAGTIADVWFKPKSFETNRELYEKLGVKKFKKIMPTSGDIVNRLILHRLNGTTFVRASDLKSLQDMETFTRILEMVHLFYFVAVSSEFVEALSKNDVSRAAFLTTANILVNIYPIMVQRYNRVRLYDAIGKMKLRDTP